MNVLNLKEEHLSINIVWLFDRTILLYKMLCYINVKENNRILRVVNTAGELPITTSSRFKGGVRNY